MVATVEENRLPTDLDKSWGAISVDKFRCRHNAAEESLPGRNLASRLVVRPVSFQ